MSRSHCFNCRKRLRTKKDIRSVDGNISCVQCYKRVKYGAATAGGEGTPATAETAPVHDPLVVQNEGRGPSGVNENIGSITNDVEGDINIATMPAVEDDAAAAAAVAAGGEVVPPAAVDDAEDRPVSHDSVSDDEDESLQRGAVDQIVIPLYVAEETAPADARREEYDDDGDDYGSVDADNAAAHDGDIDLTDDSGGEGVVNDAPDMASLHHRLLNAAEEIQEFHNDALRNAEDDADQIHQDGVDEQELDDQYNDALEQDDASHGDANDDAGAAAENWMGPELPPDEGVDDRELPPDDEEAPPLPFEDFDESLYSWMDMYKDFELYVTLAEDMRVDPPSVSVLTDYFQYVEPGMTIEEFKERGEGVSEELLDFLEKGVTSWDINNVVFRGDPSSCELLYRDGRENVEHILHNVPENEMHDEMVSRRRQIATSIMSVKPPVPPVDGDDQRPRFWPFHDETSMVSRSRDRQPFLLVCVKVKEFLQGPSSGDSMIRVPSWSLSFCETANTSRAVSDPVEAQVKTCALLHRAYCYVLASMQGCNDNVTKRLYADNEEYEYFRMAVQLLRTEIRAIRVICGHRYWCPVGVDELQIHQDFKDRHPEVMEYLERIKKAEDMSMMGGVRQYDTETSFKPQPHRYGFDLADLLTQWVNTCGGPALIIEGPDGEDRRRMELNLQPTLKLTYNKDRPCWGHDGEFEVHKLHVVRKLLFFFGFSC